MSAYGFVETFRQVTQAAREQGLHLTKSERTRVTGYFIALTTVDDQCVEDGDLGGRTITYKDKTGDSAVRQYISDLADGLIQ